jgi:hypothetical protein
MGIFEASRQGTRFRPARRERKPVTQIYGKDHSRKVDGDQEMIVWGGQGKDGELDDDARFSPAEGRWRPIARTGALWGGFNGTNVESRGVRITP